MAVKRIVANLQSDYPAQTAAFYKDLFDLETAMDLGWVSTLQTGAQETQPIQLGFASQGGSDTAVRTLTIEVDDLETTHARAISLGIKIEYGPVDEPWGLRRFYIRDPSAIPKAR